MTRANILKAAVFAAGIAATPGFALAQSSAPATSPTTPARPGPAITPSVTTPSVVTPVVPQGMMDARRASRLIGANIYNEDNTSIGEVEDLMVRQTAGPIMAVVSVGGFLGIGEKYVEVPLENLRWNNDRERWMLPGATVDSLKARPAFTFPERS